jgi:MoaA/NifB/PqqE/SkfB family radical SAM enzyme
MDPFSRPKTYVEWQIGNTCNYSCKYCPEQLRNGSVEPPSEEIILETTQSIIEHYDSLGRDVVFEFMGGEPTLIKKMPNIGKRLHNHPVNIVLKTNGSAPMEYWQQMRKYITDVVISVHRDFVDIDHLMKVIHFLKTDKNGHDINVKVLIPVTQREDHFTWGVDVKNKMQATFGVGELQFLYSNFLRGSNQYLPYTPEQWEKHAGGDSLSQIDKNKLENVSKKEKKEKALVTKNRNYVLGYTCYSGIETLVIDMLGNVFRGWCQQGGKIGNIFTPPVNWPSDTIVCQKVECNNGFDRRSKKIPPEV